MSRKSRAKPLSPFRWFNSSPEVIRLVVLMYVRFLLARNPRAKVPALFRTAACVGAEKDDIAVCRYGTRTISGE